jgi:hypothetical protein
VRPPHAGDAGDDALGLAQALYKPGDDETVATVALETRGSLQGFRARERCSSRSARHTDILRRVRGKTEVSSTGAPRKPREGHQQDVRRGVPAETAPRTRMVPPRHRGQKSSIVTSPATASYPKRSSVCSMLRQPGRCWTAVMITVGACPSPACRMPRGDPGRDLCRRPHRVRASVLPGAIGGGEAQSSPRCLRLSPRKEPI